MDSLQNPAGRREFIKTGAKSAALSVLANVAIPHVHAAGSDLIQVALIGCGGRGSGERTISQARSGQAGGYGGPVPGTAGERPGPVEAALSKPGRGAAGSPVSRLRRLSEGNGLFEAGRYRHFRNASGVSLGALHLRDPEAPECLHGKTADGGRPNEQAHVRARPGSLSPEPQGGGRADVAAQPGATGTGRPRP